MGKRTAQHEDQLALDLFVKTCPRCLRDLAGWEFAKNRARKDGLQVYCRTCWNTKQGEYYEGSEVYREQRKARSKAAYDANVEHYRNLHRLWRDSNLERVRERGRRWHADNRDKVRLRRKAWREANPEMARERARAYNIANPEKVTARHRAYRLANKDAIREYNRAYVQANLDKHNAKCARRRARMAKVHTLHFTAADLAQRWAYYGNLCWICKDSATATDHVKPIAKGGAHMLCNLRPICQPCNSAKRDKWPFDLTMAPRG